MMQEFVQEVTETVKDTLKGVHTALPGSIVSFDPGTGLATVLPTMKFKKPDGTTVVSPKVTVSRWCSRSARGTGHISLPG